METKQLVRKLYSEGKSVSQISLYFNNKYMGEELTGPQIRAYIKEDEVSVSQPIKTTKIKSPKKLPKDTYKESESTNPEKKEINKLLAKYVDKFGLQETPMVLLESPALATTKELIKVGVSKYKIFIPNHTDSYNLIKTKHPIQNVFPMTFGKFISENITTKHGLVFADYCGTLDGNSQFKPIEDLKEIFKHKRFNEISLLGVTIAKRNANKPNKYVNNDISRLNNIVGQSAYDHGYTAIDLGEGRSYHRGSMYFALYLIEKTD